MRYIIYNYIISIHLKYALLIYVCDYYITYSSTCKNSMLLECFIQKGETNPISLLFPSHGNSLLFASSKSSRAVVRYKSWSVSPPKAADVTWSTRRVGNLEGFLSSWRGRKRKNQTWNLLLVSLKFLEVVLFCSSGMVRIPNEKLNKQEFYNFTTKFWRTPPTLENKLFQGQMHHISHWGPALHFHHPNPLLSTCRPASFGTRTSATSWPLFGS